MSSIRSTKVPPDPRARSQLYSAVLAPPMWSTPVGLGANRTLMLIGAHVSTAGGLVQAHGRAVERGCEAMQVFNQSPRQWRPTRWKPDDVAEFLSLMKGGPVKSVTIHAVYLINPATKDRGMREKSAASLIHALRMGDEIKADGVVLHPGSTVGEPHEEALPRVGELLQPRARGVRALPAAAREHGRRGQHARALVRGAARDPRPGGRPQADRPLPRLVPHARERLRHRDGGQARGRDRSLRTKIVGKRRLRCLHVNDSQIPLGSNRDRHAIPGEGELGARGCAAFLSEPRFEGLPALFEGPGTSGHAPDKVDVDRMKELRRNGLRSRRRRA